MAIDVTASWARARAAGKLPLVLELAEGDCEAPPAWNDPRIVRIVHRCFELEIAPHGALPLPPAIPPERVTHPLLWVARTDGEPLVPVSCPAGVDALASSLSAAWTFAQLTRAVDPAEAEAARSRYRDACDALRRREYEAATEGLLWAFEHLVEYVPSMSGVKRSFLRAEMKRLADAHEPARAELERRRAALAVLVDGGQCLKEELADWVDLHVVLGDEERLIDWFDRTRARPERSWMLRVPARTLRDLLVARGRWADLLDLHRDPKEVVAFALQFRREAPGRVADHPRLREVPPAVARQLRRTEARARWSVPHDLYAALLHAGRGAEADAIARRLVEADPCADNLIGLVDAGSTAGRRRPEFAEWLARAEANADADQTAEIAELRARLDVLPD